MNKSFCDLCGNPANAPSNVMMILDGKVLNDPKAGIQINLAIRLVRPSSVFGVPPDLCYKCLLTLVGAIVHKSTDMSCQVKHPGIETNEGEIN